MVTDTQPSMSDENDAIIDALFASDLAKDVRSEFNARRDEGLSVHDATSAVVAHFRHLLDREEEGPVVIVVVAVLQALECAPTAAFREAALGLLREGHGFASRTEESASSRRDRDSFRERLIEMIERSKAPPGDP